jgi:hypothetical protein
MNINSKNMIQFENETSLRDFIIAGNAIFTLESVNTGRRYTYRIRKSKDERTWFISYLTGSDNLSNYTYLIAMDKNLNVRLTNKSPHNFSALPVAAVKFFIDIVRENKEIPNGLKVYHYGRCSKCGRLLTDPTSIKLGIGPFCRDII